MTLKQQEVLNTLPQTKNIAKSMRLAGYSHSTTRSGTTYAKIRKMVAKYYDPERVKADIQKYRELMVEKGEYSNLVALLTLQAKVCGLTKDNQQVNANIIGDEAIKGIVERANVKDNEKVDNGGSSKPL
jgi:hypothetical protein